VKNPQKTGPSGHSDGHSLNVIWKHEKNGAMGLFENSACIFMDRWDDLAKERAQ
jgi:hypothetical protein